MKENINEYAFLLHADRKPVVTYEELKASLEENRVLYEKYFDKIEDGSINEELDSIPFSYENLVEMYNACRGPVPIYDMGRLRSCTIGLLFDIVIFSSFGVPYFTVLHSEGEKQIFFNSNDLMQYSFLSDTDRDVLIRFIDSKRKLLVLYWCKPNIFGLGEWVNKFYWRDTFAAPYK